MKLKTFLIFIILICLVATVSAVPVSELITESKTWICPQNVFVIQLQMTGGGGGALGGNASIMGYTGFNATLVKHTDVAVIPGASYPIAIGAGSAGYAGSGAVPITLTFTTTGGQTTAFGYTAPGGGGASGTAPSTPNGGNGYFTTTLIAQNGQFGYGNISYSTAGGSGGLGYGAAGGAGGAGGTFGTGGYGGNGASGAVLITYDVDAAPIMFSGTTYDAMSGATLSGVSISIAQNIATATVSSSPSFLIPSSSNLLTGYQTVITASHAGYYTYTYTFTPYVSEYVPLDIPLIPTTFSAGAPGTLSGLVLNQYGTYIASPSVILTNSTGGMLTATTTAKGMWYLTSVPKNTVWTAVASATGYENQTATLYMGNY